MYKIGLKHNGVIIATSNLSVEEVKKLEVTKLSFILELFEKKFGLDIGQYGLNDYENTKGKFFIHIRTEDLERLREEKLIKLGL